ncbi:unnamed protein product [Rhizoctonia solani]|uniref:P-loop containing nucleoside triphosphate hydrolase protein n=1 Tax=Rhizoctonia solani TaxID=456999 RepID=A0A8H3AXE0_9AGAM|nr:unnamed protein product [Rhizoctonia solani]
MDLPQFLELKPKVDSTADLHRSLLFVLCLCAVISAAILSPRATSLVQLRNIFARPYLELINDGNTSRPATSSSSGVESLSYSTGSYNSGHNHSSVFRWNISRLLACVVSVALTITTVLSEYAKRRITGTKHPHQGINTGNRDWDFHLLINGERAEFALCLFFIYTTFLSVLTLTPTSRLQSTANHHLSVLLFVAVVTLTWRDLFLLATYQDHSVNLVDAWLPWTRVGVTLYAALLVPLCTPRPNNRQESQKPDLPNPEETASVISLVLYDFMSPLIWTAYQSAKLNYDQLPLLAHYDRADFLRQRSFAKLDPLSQPGRHLFWGVVDVFWKEYCVMGGMIIIKVGKCPLWNPQGSRNFWRQVLAELAGPVGIRYILRYLEDPSQPGYFRPWVWVLWLFLGPVIGAVAMQWYVFTTTGMLVRIEAMVAQLLFEHSLRIRMTGGHSNNTKRGSSQETISEGRGKDPSTQKQNRSNSRFVGRIHNLMSTDLNNVSRDFLLVLFFAPLRVIFNVLFLYWILGWSAIIGLFAMIALLFVPGKVVRLINTVQVEWAKRTDARVQLIVESLNIIRTVKLFAWEKRVKTQSEKKRQEELNWYRKRQFLGLFTMNINYALPLVVMIVTFASHTLLFKKPLDASLVFSSIAVFDTLRTQLRLLFLQIPASIQSKVSLDRTNDFLTKTELLDSYKSNRTGTVAPPDSAIGFCNATFTWSGIQASSPTSGHNFRLQIDGKLLFQRGRINMVIGPTGCGKTGLLMALLGEMHYISNGPDSWVSLPRSGGIAYAAQEAWIQNATIRENILFGTEYDEERYNKVILQCGLEPDMRLLESGDQTEVGEKGVKLSGGQKARVSLARAIYSKAEIIILDDVLSALDVHTSRWIIDKCFRGDLVSGRTLIIVTHNVAMVSEVADFVVALGHGGRILSQGSIGTVLGSNAKLKDEAKEELASNPSKSTDGERVETATRPSGKLTAAEEVAEGHVGWSALKLFFSAMGGVGFWLTYLVGFALANVAALLQTYWLGIWARAYDSDSAHPQVNVSFYLGTYSSICLFGMILYSSAFIIHIFGSIRASHRIHDRLVSSVFAAPLYWLDCTPIGRIIARFTQDIRAVDGSLPNELQNLTDMTIQLFSRFVAIILVSPAFTFAGAVLLALGIWIGQVYISAQLSVKRHMSNARSPMFSYFHTALGGIPTIRAYGAQDLVRKEVQARVDTYTRAARTFWNLNWIRAINEFQVQTNSLERIHSYLDIPHEPVSGTVPASWPCSGSLVVHSLGAQYGPDGPEILHDVSFEVKHGERVGIVGRTGSGKSSLVLALLRMIPTGGEVYYDGIETRSVPLESLRSNVTVVPQQPELSSGTVRENLDPFGECEDAVLWDALRAVGLDPTNTPDSDPTRPITLDTAISPGGSNLSLGQRQMVALARALVRRTQLVILDEATAAIDHETDQKIHHALGVHQTVLIVAHRLRTICGVDKVMVLDAGKLVEYDSPKALLRKDGAFKRLVDGSGEKDELCALIGRA